MVGLVLLTQPNALLLGAVLMLLCIRRASPDRRLKTGAATVAAVVAVMAPWLIWTAATPEIGGPTTTSSLGFTIAGVYSDAAWEASDHWVDPFLTPGLSQLYRPDRSEMEVDRAFARAAVSGIVHSPSRLFVVPLRNIPTLLGVGDAAREADLVDGRPGWLSVVIAVSAIPILVGGGSASVATAV